MSIVVVVVVVVVVPITYQIELPVLPMLTSTLGPGLIMCSSCFILILIWRRWSITHTHVVRCSTCSITLLVRCSITLHTSLDFLDHLLQMLDVLLLLLDHLLQEIDLIEMLLLCCRVQPLDAMYLLAQEEILCQGLVNPTSFLGRLVFGVVHATPELRHDVIGLVHAPNEIRQLSWPFTLKPLFVFFVRVGLMRHCRVAGGAPRARSGGGGPTAAGARAASRLTPNGDGR